MCLLTRIHCRPSGVIRRGSSEIRREPERDALHPLSEYVDSASPLSVIYRAIRGQSLTPTASVFIKLGSQLTAEKLTDLAIIPVIFIVQTAVSYSCAFVVTRCCGLKKRQSNFVTAMAVCDNLPI